MFTEDSIMTYSEFNRIENKIKNLRNEIFFLDYPIPMYIKKIWDNADFLLYTYLNNIENGIDDLGIYYFKPYGWQEKKIWTKGMSFSYKDVNRWWNNLNLIEERLNNDSSTLFPSETLYPSDTLYPH